MRNTFAILPTFTAAGVVVLIVKILTDLLAGVL